MKPLTKFKLSLEPRGVPHYNPLNLKAILQSFCNFNLLKDSKKVCYWIHLLSIPKVSPVHSYYEWINKNVQMNISECFYSNYFWPCFICHVFITEFVGCVESCLPSKDETLITYSPIAMVDPTKCRITYCPLRSFWICNRPGPIKLVEIDRETKGELRD